MCLATANFDGSGALGAVGVVKLTKVKHKRELLFAALPVPFAFHHFIEGGKPGDSPGRDGIQALRLFIVRQA